MGTIKKIKSLNMQKTAEDRDFGQIQVKETKDTEVINEIGHMNMVQDLNMGREMGNDRRKIS